MTNIKYSVLSHTWGPPGTEVLFEDVVNQTASQREGLTKVRRALAKAREFEDALL